MSIRTFWTLLLKILGIWLILSGISVVPQFINAFAFFGDNQQDNVFAAFYITALLFLTLALYAVVLKLLVFNSAWVIDKLKLDQGFPEERIDLNATLQTVLTIATIVLGGLILVDALPMLCKQVFTLIQQKSLFAEYPQFDWVIFYSAKALIGYLLMTNSKTVIRYVEKKTPESER